MLTGPLPFPGPAAYILCRYLYLKPVEKVLAERFRLTEGARKAAEESLRTADTKIAEYEKALGEARGEIYREQSEFLRKLHEEQAEQVGAARRRSDQRVAAIKEVLSKEAEAARSGLEAQSDVLATQIADSTCASEGCLITKPRLGQFSATLFLAAALFVVPACARKPSGLLKPPRGIPARPNQPTLNRAWNSGSGLILRSLPERWDG